jgi:hypothetical protein
MELRFRFEDHFFDVVFDAFTSQERMAVVGERAETTYQALDVQESGDFLAGGS